MKRPRSVSLNGPIIAPFGPRRTPVKQAIGGRAIKTSDVVQTLETTATLPPMLPLAPTTSVACILAAGVTHRDLVAAGLTLPSKVMISTISMAYTPDAPHDADITLQASETVNWTTTLDALRATQHYDIMVWLSSAEAIGELANAITVLSGSPNWLMVLPGRASCAVQINRLPRDMTSEALVKAMRGFVALGDGVVQWGAPS